MRDLLLRLALAGLFAARWSEQIQQEWTRNVLTNRPELADKLPRTVDLMNSAVPDARVNGHEPLIAGLTLPDVDDRHVLAAAIRAGAQIIVTFNLRDFPAAQLLPFGVEAVHPDEFITQQFDLHEGRILSAVRAHRRSLRNPPKTIAEYLDTLAAQGLVVTVERLWRFADVL